MQSIMRYKGRAKTPEELTTFIKKVNSKAPWELKGMHSKLSGELAGMKTTLAHTDNMLKKVSVSFREITKSAKEVKHMTLGGLSQMPVTWHPIRACEAMDRYV